MVYVVCSVVELVLMSGRVQTDCVQAMQEFYPWFSLYCSVLLLKIDSKKGNKNYEILPILQFSMMGEGTIDIVGPLDKPTKDLMINYHKIMSLCSTVSYFCSNIYDISRAENNWSNQPSWSVSKPDKNNDHFELFTLAFSQPNSQREPSTEPVIAGWEPELSPDDHHGWSGA